MPNIDHRIALLLCEGLMLDDPDWDTRHFPQVVGLMLVDPCGTRGTPLLHGVCPCHDARESMSCYEGVHVMP